MNGSLQEVVSGELNRVIFHLPPAVSPKSTIMIATHNPATGQIDVVECSWEPSEHCGNSVFRNIPTD
jgi:hypothetical protein